MNVLVYAFAFGAVAVLMPTVLRLSAVLGAVDVPDGGRKRHRQPTARLGGLAIFTVFFAASVIAFPLTDGRVCALLSGGTVLFAAGLCDDVRPLPPSVKLLFQAGASACALLWLPCPTALTVGTLTLPLTPALSFALCLFLCLCLINAINFIDGVDAQAAGILCVGHITLSLLYGEQIGRGLCLLITVCLLSFLLYNRPPALVFMGDGGSQFLGLAAAVLLLTRAPSFASGSLLLFAVPLVDLAFGCVRRLAHGKSPFQADGGHLHHRLLRRGFSPAATAALMTAFSVCFALVGYGLCLGAA